ncbi:PadR family transcriptional regulator [Salibacterium halotolerans]|uniref:DNA-binding transcriptional regulator, PadR family n=1 Tax=Salibacterium halotolerans TaxID=1884432 RepID=A0A1I5PHX1_9BACI|nr:PadR family transcriptional regulator [Salibacterium halotolerans]SFP33447.1 DNA-binding transcriptional regulator, PadR family [Salibacterium halotolerans]
MAARRVLKYAILGLLRKDDKSGYDITSDFKQAIGQFWSAKHSQIYTELKKLLEEELISSYIELSGEKLEKKMYTLTEKGKEDLHTWLLTQDDHLETEKDVFALRLYFLKDIPSADLLALFENQLNLRTNKLNMLKEQYAYHFGEENRPVDLDADDLGHYFVLTKAISREENYIFWLMESMDIIRQRQYGE